MKSKIDVSFVFCDYSNDYHCRMLAALINEYIADPMGGGSALSLREQLHVVDGLATHPACLVLFAISADEIIGMVVGFINFSTFKAKKYLNIHDVIVKKSYRECGVGRALLEKCISISQERKYCKLTLEVRSDNTSAQALYKSLGFDESSPSMHFWSKIL
jgi:ribosomal protein S18 acetylase RimI-like enzyme